MSIHNSRFQGQEIVNSFNMFIDTEKSSIVGDRQSKGDDVQIHFEGQSIVGGDGENIRLSLLNFNMFNNIYQINVHNSRFKVKGLADAGATEPNNFFDELALPRKNYKTINEIAFEFAELLKTYLKLKANPLVGSFTSVNLPEINGAPSVGETGNRLLDITLTAKTVGGIATAHGIPEFTIQMEEATGETYCILGGNRQDDTSDTTFQSLKITIATNTIRIQGFYPMQRTSDPYIYLRCNNAQSGLETSVLSSDRGRLPNDVVNSDILARIFRDTEYVTYESATGEEYFINLQTRKLSNLRLFLTDSKGRKLGRLNNESQDGTASGLPGSAASAGTDAYESKFQSTLGNLFFTAVIRVDILKTSSPVKLQSGGLQPSLPASKNQGLYVWQDYGQPKH